MDCKNCLVIETRETDYVFGANSPIAFKAVCSDWVTRIKYFERQKIQFETDGCVLFTAQESLDAQIENLIALNLIPQPTLDLFTSLGYMDTASDGKPHFHSSPRFLQVLTGNGQRGNSMQSAWDVMRKYGVLPWKDLPYDDTTTLQQYFSPIPQNLLDKAKQFLAAIGGKDSIQYHWIIVGGEGRATDIPAMAKALPAGPLCLGTPVCEPWDQSKPPLCSGQPSVHSTMAYELQGNDVLIEDHYVPEKKVLQNGYPIPYAMQGIISVTPPPPAPVLPPNPTLPQTISWLEKVRKWLNAILNTIKGRSLGSTNNMNILKSRTFWTVVVAFIFNGFQATSGAFPASVVDVMNTVFSVLTVVFHVNPSQPYGKQA